MQNLKLDVIQGCYKNEQICKICNKSQNYKTCKALWKIQDLKLDFI